MHEWLREHGWFGATIVGGIVVSVLTAENQSVRVTIARMVAGIFCAVFFTDPLIDYFDRDPMVYRNAVAGLLAVTGYAVTRMLNAFKFSDIVDLIKAWRRS